jgi:hypothetical protein
LKFRSLFFSFLLLPAALFSPPLQAQVSPASSRPLFLSVYGTAGGSEHELNYGHALGGSAGFILAHNPLLALDVRGTILRAHVPLHTYIGEAGPRVSRRFGRLQPFAEVMAGLGHSGFTPSGSALRSAYGWTWTLDGGLDLRVSHHLEWRVAEYSYNHIYAGTGAKPAILNTGVVYRF